MMQSRREFVRSACGLFFPLVLPFKVLEPVLRGSERGKVVYLTLDRKLGLSPRGVGNGYRWRWSAHVNEYLLYGSMGMSAFLVEAYPEKADEFTRENIELVAAGVLEQNPDIVPGFSRKAGDRVRISEMRDQADIELQWREAIGAPGEIYTLAHFTGGVDRGDTVE